MVLPNLGEAFPLRDLSRPFWFREGAGLLLEMVEVPLAGLDRRMHRVEGQVEQEGFLAVALEKPDGLVRQPVGEVLARRTVTEFRVLVRGVVPTGG